MMKLTYWLIDLLTYCAGTRLSEPFVIRTQRASILLSCCPTVLSLRRHIASTFAILLCALAATTNAQQMTINSATQTYEKRLATAKQVRSAEVAKVNAAYDDTLRRINAEYSIRVQGALRSAKDEDAPTLQKMLATLAAPVSTASKTLSGGTVSASDFEKLFASLVGTWIAKEQTYYTSSEGSSTTQVEYTYLNIFEFKNSKTLARSQRRIYQGGTNSETKQGEYRARLRDGKIVFESSGSSSSWYEIPIPFDLENLEIIYSYERPGQIRENTIKLTKQKL